MSKEAEMPNARSMRINVEKVILLPFSNLEIWERCTPTFSPSCSCVR